MEKKSSKIGFTLIELLIVIAIIAILAVIVVIAVNPTKIMEKSRDSQRLSDMTSVATALNLFLADNHDLSELTLGTVYNSTDGTDATRKKNDGSGWIPIDFTVVTSGAPLSALPVDPTNDLGKALNYRFGGVPDAKTYEIDCKFEAADNTGKHATDGGNNDLRYEMGTDLSILL